MFRIKICGITNVGDALAAAEAGADAVGLNFFAGSKRCVSIETAGQVVAATGREVQPVGVFVNAPAQTVSMICHKVGLRAAQLHGDERPERYKVMVALHELGVSNPSLSIIRAHSFGPGGMNAVYEDMFDASDDAADMVLIDAAVSGMFGGTGQTVDWNRLVNFQASIGHMPLVLAGGLTPENVAEAIRIVRPDAVDVASGVESSPGKKDHSKLRDFVSAAKDAFSRA